MNNIVYKILFHGCLLSILITNSPVLGSKKINWSQVAFMNLETLKTYTDGLENSQKPPLMAYLIETASKEPAKIPFLVAAITHATNMVYQVYSTDFSDLTSHERGSLLTSLSNYIENSKSSLSTEEIKKLEQVTSLLQKKI